MIINNDEVELIILKTYLVNIFWYYSFLKNRLFKNIEHKNNYCSTLYINIYNTTNPK